MVRNVRRPRDATSQLSRQRELWDKGLMELGGHVVSINEIERLFSKEMMVYDMLPKVVRDGLKEGNTKEFEKWLEEEKAKRASVARTGIPVKQREID